MNSEPLIPLIQGMGWPVFWALATIAAYYAGKALYARFHATLVSPLIFAPLVLLLLAVLLHANYHDYTRGTHWLMAMLGPVTVAFAIPIYQQRELIRRHWKILGAGVLVGSTVAIVSAWYLSTLLNLSSELRLSLTPRSITTPLAMEVSDEVGGVAELTAVFVILTGICGSLVGQVILKVLPVKSSMARGALLGMGAHGMGVAKAREIGDEEGAIAGLVMVMAGLINVMVAPLLIRLL
ncbi:LrgB family protein [Xanthomonas massiliensis]|uniref:LrgB family protein n=1 Tax=Xanthomonas massiliensis TaxID=1720302 RepID=UPI000AC55237|nr:LrgB family protein [Xanthomonas massiliensis]